MGGASGEKGLNGAVEQGGERTRDSRIGMELSIIPGVWWVPQALATQSLAIECFATRSMVRNDV